MMANETTIHKSLNKVGVSNFYSSTAFNNDENIYRIVGSGIKKVIKNEKTLSITNELFRNEKQI